MGNIQPKSEALRRAIRWISDEMAERDPKEKKKIVSEAIFRFNLNPGEEQFLINMYSGTE